MDRRSRVLIQSFRHRIFSPSNSQKNEPYIDDIGLAFALQIIIYVFYHIPLPNTYLSRNLFTAQTDTVFQITLFYIKIDANISIHIAYYTRLFRRLKQSRYACPRLAK